MVFMLVIVMYPATTNTAIYTTMTAITVWTEAISKVDLTVYGQLQIVCSLSAELNTVFLMTSSSQFRHDCLTLE